MNWYTAKLIYRIITGDGNHHAQFEEQLRLIKACDESEAFERARAIGCAGQDSFLNCHAETVQWQFIAVAAIGLLAVLEDGAELYYSISEEPDKDAAEQYVASVQAKADVLDRSKRPVLYVINE